MSAYARRRSSGVLFLLIYPFQVSLIDVSTLRPSQRPSDTHGSLSWPWLAALLPLLMGGPLIYWQAERSLEHQAQDSLRRTLTEIEQIFDYADNATREVATLIGADCRSAELTLRERSMATPFVRSLNLVTDGDIYCTSLRGPIRSPEEYERYTQGRLRLMPGNLVTPDRPLLVFRRFTDKGSVLAGIDAQYLIDALQLGGHVVPLTLEIGDYRLDADGKTLSADATRPAPIAAVSSSRYPFSLQAAPPVNGFWQFLHTQFDLMLALLLLLCVMFGGGAHWLGQRRVSPLRELRRGLKHDEFVPYFQPFVDNARNRWQGVEVLMRWQHPREGLIPPDQFIPLAETSGLIAGMTHRLMTHVVEALKPHADQLPPDFHISFNITEAHCRDQQLLEYCRQFLASFPPGRVTLVMELTERGLLVPTRETNHLFSGLRHLGVRIAIDDFGTGNASLAYLRQFPFDYLKIDRSYVDMVGRDSVSRHLLDNILDLATRLQLGIVAEGIETPEQRDYLSQRGVRYLQGYLYARPMALEPLLATLGTPPTRASLPEHAPS